MSAQADRAEAAEGRRARGPEQQLRNWCLPLGPRGPGLSRAGPRCRRIEGSMRTDSGKLPSQLYLNNWPLPPVAGAPGFEHPRAGAPDLLIY